MERPYPIKVETNRIDDNTVEYVITISDGSIIKETYSNKKIEIEESKLFNLLAKAYKEGYSSYELVEAGLEPYDPEGYARWILRHLSIKA